jgi:hypothetical protein
MWIEQAQQKARELSELAADTAAFRRWAEDAVAGCRDLLKLAPSAVSFDDV